MVLIRRESGQREEVVSAISDHFKAFIFVVSLFTVRAGLHRVVDLRLSRRMLDIERELLDWHHVEARGLELSNRVVIFFALWRPQVRHLDPKQVRARTGELLAATIDVG